MWNYVFYKAYLNFKEKTEFNGYESYVHDKIEKNDISWFPIKRAKAMLDGEDDEKDTTGIIVGILNEFKELTIKVEKLFFKVKSILAD